MRRNDLRLGTGALLHIWSGVLDECTRSSRVRIKHQCTTGTGEWAMAILYYDLCRDRPHHHNIDIQLLLRCNKRSCITITTLLRRITEREPMWYNMLCRWTVLCGQRVLRSEQCTGRIQQQCLHCAGRHHSNEHGIHSTDQ